MNRILAVLLLSIAFGGCSTAPRYQTEYTYDTPADQAQRNCVAQCTIAKSACTRGCVSSNEQCQRDSDRDWQAYNECQREVFAKRKQSYQCPGAPAYDCNKDCSCVEDYNACYKACGLGFTSQQKCYENCEPEKKN